MLTKEEIKFMQEEMDERLAKEYSDSEDKVVLPGENLESFKKDKDSKIVGESSK
jgi:hypothetical protein